MPANPAPKEKEVLPANESTALGTGGAEGSSEREAVTERVPETAPENAVRQSGEHAPVSTTPSAKIILEPSTNSKDALYSEVEQILEENMDEVFKTLSPGDQLRFKIKGEETAQTIQTLIQSARVTARKILGLILTWLKMIPGVNKFFLEQESKIKTDEIMALAKKQIDGETAAQK